MGSGIHESGFATPHMNSTSTAAAARWSRCCAAGDSSARARG
jgi:hypothetical protein